jgi:hypothetical protein
VGAAADGDAGPGLLDDVDAHGQGCGVLLDEVLANGEGELLVVAGGVVAGEGVDGVAHGVGGQNARVVAFGVAGGEVALEGDVDGEVAQLVAVAAAGQLEDADVEFAVAVLTESDRHGPRSAR